MIFKVSEFIAILDIVINAVLIIGLATLIQKNQVNSRSLKDYFMREMEKLQLNLTDFLEKLEDGNILPKDVQKWFFSSIAVTNNISKLIESKYKIKQPVLIQNLLEIQRIIESDAIYTANFHSNTSTVLDPLTIDSIRDFRSRKMKHYHEMILNINDFNKTFI
jgi:hypothetical protein